MLMSFASVLFKGTESGMNLSHQMNNTDLEEEKNDQLCYNMKNIVSHISFF